MVMASSQGKYDQLTNNFKGRPQKRTHIQDTDSLAYLVVPKYFSTCRKKFLGAACFFGSMRR